MAVDKITTRDLFRAIGKTERTRSAKADSVFRQLRNEIKPPHKADTPAQSIEAPNHISAMMKTASRQSV